jgi:hypothetical protein
MKAVGHATLMAQTSVLHAEMDSSLTFRLQLQEPDLVLTRQRQTAQLLKI